jgi:outer membrane biosynthesis protein TonB
MEEIQKFNTLSSEFLTYCNEDNISKEEIDSVIRRGLSFVYDAKIISEIKSGMLLSGINRSVDAFKIMILYFNKPMVNYDASYEKIVKQKVSKILNNMINNILEERRKIKEKKEEEKQKEKKDEIKEEKDEIKEEKDEIKEEKDEIEEEKEEENNKSEAEETTKNAEDFNKRVMELIDGEENIELKLEENNEENEEAGGDRN